MSGAGLKAGHYTGSITIEGPPGIGPTNVALNLNAQDMTLFWWILIPTSLAVLALLIWRGVVGAQNDKAKQVASDVRAATQTDAAGGSTATVAGTTATVAEQANETQHPLKDPTFWVSTVLAVFAAAAGAWAVLNSNTGWGADPITDGFALVSAIVAAAGFRSLIVSAAGK